MNTNDRKEFADNFMLTCLAYDKPFKPELAHLYFADLSNYAPEQISQAMSNHRKDPDRGRFFPTVADLVYQLNKITGSNSAAEMEWQRVLSAAAKGQSPTGNQVTIGALQMLGGRDRVGYAEPAELNQLRRQFMDNYKNLAECSAAQVPDFLRNALELKQLKQQVVKRG